MARPGAWLPYALLSAAAFAGMAACVRLTSADLPQAEVVFFRNFIALLVLAPVLLRRRTPLRTRHLRLHLLRAGAGLSAMYLYFYALFHLPLADAILLNYTSPLFVTLFAILWLGESWTRRRLLAAFAGLAGVMLLFHPSSRLASLAGLAGLASGALAGLALTTVKRLSGSEPALRVVLYFTLLATLTSALPMLAGGFVPPVGETRVWLVVMGLCGGAGQLALTRAYGLAPAARVSPTGYASLLFATLIGYLVWGELPDASGVAGGAAIIAAGVLVARERREPMPEPPGSVPATTGEARER